MHSNAFMRQFALQLQSERNTVFYTANKSTRNPAFEHLPDYDLHCGCIYCIQYSSLARNKSARVKRWSDEKHPSLVPALHSEINCKGAKSLKSHLCNFVKMTTVARINNVNDTLRTDSFYINVWAERNIRLSEWMRDKGRRHYTHSESSNNWLRGFRPAAVEPLSMPFLPRTSNVITVISWTPES